MELIKDIGKFQEAEVLFIGSVKQSWQHATLLALSAIAHYHETKDSTWIARTANTLMKGDGSYIACFEKALYSTTNVKLRMDESNLEAPVTATHKGNMPEGYISVMESITKEGLRRYEKSVRTKSRAATFNRDGAKAPASNKKSAAADVVNLELTDLGKQLLSGVDAASKLEGDASAKAAELAAKFSADMEKLSKGEALDSTGGTSLSEEQAATMNDLIEKVNKIASVKGTESVNGLIKSFKNQVDAKYAAIGAALVDLAEAV